MKYLTAFFVLLVPAVLGQGIIGVLEGTQCENLFKAVKEAMEMQREDFYGPQNFFDHLGISLTRPKQLQKFACKLPEIKTIKQLSDISPLNNYNAVAREYLEKLYKMNEKAGGIETIIKRFRLYVAIHEEGQFLQGDVASFPWFVDENDALIFFSKLVRDFGVDFPTFLLNEASSYTGQFYNMTDVSRFVGALYKFNSIGEVSSYLGVNPRLFEAFLRIMYYATKEDLNNIKTYKRTYILMERLNEIGFFELSVV